MPSVIAGLFGSSIGKKFLVALTGLFLCSYLVVHVAGNLLLFKQDGGKSFDEYAEFLPSLLIVRLIEWGLFAAFAAHIAGGTAVWWKNRRARPARYEKNAASDTSALTSRTMFVTGSIVFIFLVLHLRTFWVPARFAHDAGPGPFSMYAIVVEAFSSPVYAVFYVAAMGLLAFHLRHGFQSAFQTFGLREGAWARLIQAVAVLFWLVIPALFAAMPIYFLMRS
jgi:succinate dehydrogenase / fumarate reductase cytochrome b subunit